MRRLRGEDVFMLAAGLAFYALVSVAPFAILVLWVLSVVTSDTQVQEVADRLARLAPHRLSLDEAFRRVPQLGAGLGLGAVVALLWPATAYGAGIRRSFERLSPSRDREAKGLRGRALALALLGVVPALPSPAWWRLTWVRPSSARASWPALPDGPWPWCSASPPAG